jgi:hypothetical protein
VKSFWSRVEAKVKAAGLYTLAATIVVAAINALLNGSVIPQSPHAWFEFALTVAAPPVLAFLGGWLAPHQSSPPVILPPVSAQKTMATADDLLKRPGSMS